MSPAATSLQPACRAAPQAAAMPSLWAHGVRLDLACSVPLSSSCGGRGGTHGAGKRTAQPLAPLPTHRADRPQAAGTGTIAQEGRMLMCCYAQSRGDAASKAGQIVRDCAWRDGGGPEGGGPAAARGMRFAGSGCGVRVICASCTSRFNHRCCPALESLHLTGADAQCLLAHSRAAACTQHACSNNHATALCLCPTAAKAAGTMWHAELLSGGVAAAAAQSRKPMRQ